jgi:hypothetical protein
MGIFDDGYSQFLTRLLTRQRVTERRMDHGTPMRTIEITDSNA